MESPSKAFSDIWLRKPSPKPPGNPPCRIQKKEFANDAFFTAVSLEGVKAGEKEVPAEVKRIKEANHGPGKLAT